MGYLVSEQPFTVIYDAPIGRRAFQTGVNKDVTPEMADHWYVKAAGARYIDKLEDAHKQTPELQRSAQAARAEWESAARHAVQAGIQAESLRQDLKKLEKEFGIPTRELDDFFEKTFEDERARYDALMVTSKDADDEKSDDEKSDDEQKSSPPPEKKSDAPKK